jgi:hypothetical protein
MKTLRMHLKHMDNIRTIVWVTVQLFVFCLTSLYGTATLLLLSFALNSNVSE